MSRKIFNQKGLHYITMTVVGWIDVFSRKVYRDIIIDSLKYCQKEKSLVVNAYVIMSNHIHLICYVDDGKLLTDVIRDFKKYTSKKIIGEIRGNKMESRKSWMMALFQNYGKENKKNQEYQFWQNGNYPKQLISRHWIKQKLNYIHENPVKNGLVEKAEDYLYSSAPNYYELSNVLIDVELIDFGICEGYMFMPSEE